MAGMMVIQTITIRNRSADFLCYLLLLLSPFFPTDLKVLFSSLVHLELKTSVPFLCLGQTFHLIAMHIWWFNSKWGSTLVLTEWLINSLISDFSFQFSLCCCSISLLSNTAAPKSNWGHAETQGPMRKESKYTWLLNAFGAAR